MDRQHFNTADLGEGAVLAVDLSAVAQNYRTLRQRAAPACCAAVVKADGYGLGAAEIAPILQAEGCENFFVATLVEGMALRQALDAEPRIYVLNGLPPGAEITCARAGLIPVLNSLEQCAAWAKLDYLPAVLQVDTGMSRLGLSPQDQELLLSALRQRLNLVLVMSHLANADEPEHPSNQAQLQEFVAAHRRFPDLAASLCNSAGIFLGETFHFDLCRPGAALYGLECGPDAHGIVPVVQLYARIVQLRSIPAGAGVGYGHQFVADRPMRLATIAIGYADGWPRSLSNQGAAWLGDVRLPIIGRVSMDSFMVDVSNLPEPSLKPGDTVELIGPHQSIDAVAQTAGTIGYEILTGLGQRFRRVYISTDGSRS